MLILWINDRSLILYRGEMCLCLVSWPLTPDSAAVHLTKLQEHVQVIFHPNVKTYLYYTIKVLKSSCSLFLMSRWNMTFLHEIHFFMIIYFPPIDKQKCFDLHKNKTKERQTGFPESCQQPSNKHFIKYCFKDTNIKNSFIPNEYDLIPINKFKS